MCYCNTENCTVLEEEVSDKWSVEHTQGLLERNPCYLLPIQNNNSDYARSDKVFRK